MSHDPALVRAASPKGMDRRGKRHSSTRAQQGCVRDSEGTSGSRSRRSSDVVFTTLQVLPRAEREEQRSSGSRTLPKLLTGQQTQSKVSAELQKVSVHDMLRESIEDISETKMDPIALFS